MQADGKTASTPPVQVDIMLLLRNRDSNAMHAGWGLLGSAMGL